MKRILVLLLFSVLIAGTVLFARVQEPETAEHAEATAAEHAEEHEESPWAAVFRWGNAIVLFGALIYLLRKPAGEFFENRRNQITSGLERAREAQTGANARMDEIEQRLATLSADVTALRSEAEREAAAERDKILAEAKREVERVVEQSRQEIERVARTIEREIKEQIADSVVERAGNTLQTQMTEDDQKRVVVRFIKKL
jgi:F-type H+-transporting ATPase subunit b